MVKKLIKHEIMYYVRTLAIFMPWVLVIGIISRILVEFAVTNYEDPFIVISAAGTYIVLFLSVVALTLFCTAVGIVRFYKNMYSAEGYLTFTLPVTNVQHIMVKLFVYDLALLVCGLICALGVIISLPSVAHQGLRSAFSDLAIVLGDIPVVHLVFFAIEYTALLLFSFVTAPLLYYACISIGQTAKKNRVLMAIAAYFIYNIGIQVISTITTISFTIIAATPAAEMIMNYFAEHAYLSTHITLIFYIIVAVAMSLVFYLVTLNIMNKKLNLE